MIFEGVHSSLAIVRPARTAAFVRDFSGLRDRMQIVTNAATFDDVLRASCRATSGGARSEV
jgi:hypothetical protein